MDENMNPQNEQQHNFYEQENNAYGQQNNAYGQENNYYGQQPHMNNVYQPYGQVKDIFCNILLVIMPIRLLLGLISSVVTFVAMENVAYNSVMDGSYLTAITTSPGYTVLSMVSNLLFVLYIIFVVLDITTINKANYKITGLILFAIFLNYGYYIWRAYILGRKKAFPIIYTVAYSLLAVANIIVTVVYTMNMTMNMMTTMM